MAAAVAAQMALGAEAWPPECAIRVRMALHTAEGSLRDGDYYGRPVNRVARLRAISEGGQILVSQLTAEMVMDHLPEGSRPRPLGPRILKDMDRPETVYEVVVDPAGADSTVNDPTPRPSTPESTPWTHGARPGSTSRSWRPARPRVVPDPRAQGRVGARRHDGSRHFDSNELESVDYPEDEPTRPFKLDQPEIVIGRGTPTTTAVPDLDLGRPPEDVGVSRRHAILERQPDGRYALIDAVSTNGTFVNDLTSPIPTGCAPCSSPTIASTSATSPACACGAWTTPIRRGPPDGVGVSLGLPTGGQQDLGRDGGACDRLGPRARPSSAPEGSQMRTRWLVPAALVAAGLLNSCSSTHVIRTTAATSAAAVDTSTPSGFRPRHRRHRSLLDRPALGLEGRVAFGPTPGRGDQAARDREPEAGRHR